MLYRRDELPSSELGFIPLLNPHRTTDTAGADPAAPQDILYLFLLAVKYLARGDHQRQAAIHERLRIRPWSDAAILRQVVTDRVDVAGHPLLGPAVEAAGCWTSRTGPLGNVQLWIANASAPAATARPHRCYQQ